MSSISFSGLGSGIDTASMVKQLMQVERLSGKGLLEGRATSQSLVNIMTSLNGQMKTLGDAAKALVPDTLLGGSSAFTSVTATSSNKDIATATATASATQGSLSFAVKSIAQASSGTVGGDFTATAGVADTDFTLTLRSGDKSADVTIPAGSTIADVAALINKSDSGVKATTVQVAPDTYRLQLSSAATGVDNKLTITDASGVEGSAGALGTYKELTAAQDTVLAVGGGEAAGGYDVRSSTRDVKDVLPGVTISPVKADPAATVTIDLTPDVEGIAGKLEAFVKAANDALGTISKNSKWDAEKKTGGVLLGDSTTRALAQQIQTAFTGSATVSPDMVGISIERDGTLKFDKAKFTANYKNDPAAVAAAGADIAGKIADVSKQATGAADGTLTLRIQAEQNLVKDYGDQVKKFEDRMGLREDALKRQFSAMESLLSKMQAQGNWLAGQLATLPTGGF